MTEHAARTEPEFAATTCRDGVYRLIAIIGAMVSCTGFYLSMIEMTAILDGPGIGMLSSRQGLGVFSTLWFVGGFVFLGAANRLRNWRWSLTIVVGGLVYFIVLSASGLGQRILGVVWANRCNAGDPHSCYAAGGIHKHVLGSGEEARSRGNKFYLEGCKLGTQIDISNEREVYDRDRDRSWSAYSCRLLLEDQKTGNAGRLVACRGLSSICAINRESACERHDRTCVPKVAKRDEGYCDEMRRECSEGGNACSDAMKMGCGEQNKGEHTTIRSYRTAPQDTKMKRPAPDGEEDD